MTIQQILRDFMSFHVALTHVTIQQISRDFMSFDVTAINEPAPAPCLARDRKGIYPIFLEPSLHTLTAPLPYPAAMYLVFNCCRDLYNVTYIE